MVEGQQQLNVSNLYPACAKNVFSKFAAETVHNLLKNTSLEYVLTTDKFQSNPELDESCHFSSVMETDKPNEPHSQSLAITIAKVD